MKSEREVHVTADREEEEEGDVTSFHETSLP